MLEPDNPSLMEWFFRFLAAIGSLFLIGYGYILSLNSKRMDSLEASFKTDLDAVGVRADTAEKAAQENRLAIKSTQLDIKNTELDMAKLQIHITETFCNKAENQHSLGRLYDQMEANSKDIRNQIDQLRRDLQKEIRDNSNASH